jgi:plasmid maintenance system antidote protein VapI
MKALTVEPSTGSAISDIAISDALTNTVIALSPEIALLELEGSKSYTYYYDVVNSLGTPTGAIGGGANTPSRQSSYSRNSVTMKSIRNKGAVADFLRDVSEQRIDAVAVEMENQLLAQTWDVNYNVIYGNNTANGYEMNGWETMIPAANRTSYFSSGAPTVPGDLTILNDMIAYSDRKGGNRHRKAFICSPEMNQRLGFLLTSTRIQYGIPGTLETVEINGGYRLTAYQGIPILPSTFLGGQGAGTMGSISLASGGTTGGSFSDGTYYAAVTYVSKYGESKVSRLLTDRENITAAQALILAEVLPDLSAEQLLSAQGRIELARARLRYRPKAVIIPRTDSDRYAELRKLVEVFQNAKSYEDDAPLQALRDWSHR